MRQASYCPKPCPSYAKESWCHIPCPIIAQIRYMDQTWGHIPYPTFWILNPNKGKQGTVHHDITQEDSATRTHEESYVLCLLRAATETDLHACFSKGNQGLGGVPLQQPPSPSTKTCGADRTSGHLVARPWQAARCSPVERH